MDVFRILLVVLYVYFIIRNYNLYTNGKEDYILTFFTASLSLIMLCSSNIADYDLSDTELDISAYRYLYEEYNMLEYEGFGMYYIFYSLMYIGKYLGISYRLWWLLMSIAAMAVIYSACKIHKYNFNLFLVVFMSYYELIFYSGLKFFYGACFLLLAYGFLLRNTTKGKLYFAFFCCVAGGFHIMYYFYLLLLIKPLKQPKYLVTIVVIFIVFFTVLLRLSQSASSFLLPFFEALDNEHINKYTNTTVRSGFYIAVLIHSMVVYMAYRMRQSATSSSRLADSLYYTVLLSLMFVPLYAVSLTFMRLITAFSLVVIAACSSLTNDSSKNYRLLCGRISLIIVFTFLFTKIITSIGAFRGFYEASVKPFFDVF